MMFLLDTNVVIDHFQTIHTETASPLGDYQKENVCVSSVTVAELFHGAHKSHASAKNIQKLEEFLRLPNVKVIPFATQLAHEYGKLMAELERGGQKIGSLDVMIAATAESVR